MAVHPLVAGGALGRQHEGGAQGLNPFREEHAHVVGEVTDAVPAASAGPVQIHDEWIETAGPETGRDEEAVGEGVGQARALRHP